MEKVIPQNFKAPFEKHFTFKTKQNFYDAVHDMFGTKTESLENCSDYILSATTKAFGNIQRQTVRNTKISIRAGENSVMECYKDTFTNKDGSLDRQESGVRVIMYGRLITFPATVNIDDLHTAVILYDHTMTKLKALKYEDFDKNQKLIDLKKALEANFKAMAQGKTKGLTPALKKQTNANIIGRLKKACKAKALKNILVSNNLLNPTRTYPEKPDEFLEKAPALVEGHLKYLATLKNWNANDLLRPDKKLETNVKNEADREQRRREVQEVDFDFSK